MWPAIETYLALPDEERDYNSSAASLMMRLGMFHQLWLAYGDEFYITLHKETREESPNISSTQDKMRYLMLKASTISGHDLSKFFQQWGLPVPQSVYGEIATLGLPEPGQDLTQLRD